MFLAALAGFGSLGRADGFGHVTRERDSEFLRFLCDREIRLAREAVINLQEIRARGRQQRHRESGFFRRPDRVGVGAGWTGSQQERSVQKARGGDARILGARAPRTQSGDRNPGIHFANSGDAVGDQRTHRVSIGIQVDVHVPQAGDQEFAGGIDDAGARRRLDAPADRGDAAVGNRDRDVFARRSAGRIDDRGVLKDDTLSERNRQEGSETEQPEEQTDPTSYLVASDFLFSFRLTVAILRVSKLLRRRLSLLMPL